MLAFIPQNKYSKCGGVLKEKELIYRLRKTFYGIDSEIAKISKKVGCNFNLLCFLQALDSSELKSQKQICEEWLITKTTLNTMVKQCEKLGYINFKPVDGAKREKYIVLTKKGREFKENILTKIYPVEKEALFSTPEFEKFVENIGIFYLNLKKAHEKM